MNDYGKVEPEWVEFETLYQPHAYLVRWQYSNLSYQKTYNADWKQVVEGMYKQYKAQRYVETELLNVKRLTKPT